MHDIRPSTPADVRLLLPACVAWAVVAATLSCSGWVRALSIATGLVVAFVAARRRHRHPRAAVVVALCGLVVALDCAALAGHLALRGAGTVDELAAQRASVRLRAEVVSDPRLVGGGAEGAAKAMVRLRVTEVEGRGTRSAVTTPVLVFAGQEWLRVRWGQRVEAVGRLAPSDPGDDVSSVLQARGPPRVVGEPSTLLSGAERVRAGLRAAMVGLPADSAGLIPGLVIGDTSLTPPDLSADMTAVQMSHLSAVSGSNVSVVLAAVLGLCGLVGLPRRVRPWAALAGLAGFVVLARPEPSVIRAAVMGGVGLVGVSASRRRSAFPALAVAIVGLLAYDPWLARSYGFALSTLATLGLLLFATPWGEALGRRLPRRLSGCGPALAIPLAAQVMCGPVTILLQPSVSLVGVPANLLAAPFVAPTTVLGIGCGLLAAVSVPLAHLLGWLATLPALAIAWVARTAADVPHGAVPWPPGAVGALLLAALTVVLVVSGRRLAWWSRARPVLTVALVLLAAALCLPTRTVTWPVPGWRAVVCDVGQGDGIVLASGDRRAVVVDTGTPDGAIRGCLSRLGIERVDAVVLTHFHNDHVGGLEQVLDGWPVDTLLVTATREPEQEARRVDRLAAAHRLTPVVVAEGDTFTFGQATAQVLGPRRTGRPSANDASIVLLADVVGTRLLLTGDVEPEAAAAANAARRRHHGTEVDVLKVAHHGSAKQDARLLAELDAPLALISVGEGNDYGQPAPSALSLLGREGYQVERTDRSGDLAVLGHGDGLRLARRGR